MSVNFFWVLLFFYAQGKREAQYMEKQIVFLFQIVDDWYMFIWGIDAGLAIQ